MIVKLSPTDDGPLCPNAGGTPANEAHMLRVRVVDAFYNAAEKDADGEMAPPLDAAYSAAAYGRDTGIRMDLYHEAVQGVVYGQIVTVETWWFQCHVCGLILPATRRERP